MPMNPTMRSQPHEHKKQLAAVAQYTSSNNHNYSTIAWKMMFVKASNKLMYEESLDYSFSLIVLGIPTLGSEQCVEQLAHKSSFSGSTNQMPMLAKERHYCFNKQQTAGTQVGTA